MKRFPGGSNERWEKIADILERYPWEVTKMAKKVRDNAYMVRFHIRSSPGKAD
jgi:hypothetical protein